MSKFAFQFEKAYINGQWVDADNKATIDVTNPATGELIGTVPNMGAMETRRAIEAANKALPAWRSKTAKERARILRNWFDLIMKNQEALAQLMTAEQGKPLAESKGEISYGASFIEWFGEEAKRVWCCRVEVRETDSNMAGRGGHREDNEFQ